MVLIKGSALVGKKMECPKCKDQFVIAKPPSKKAANDSDDELVAAPSGKAVASKSKSSAAAKSVSAKSKAGYAVEDDDTPAPAAKKSGAVKKAKVDEDEDEEDEKPAKPAVKKAPAKPAPDDEEDEKPAKPAKKAPPKPAAEDDDEEEEITEAEPDDDEEEAEETPKPAKKAAAKAKAETNGDDEEEEEAPKPSKKALVKVKPAADEEEEEEISEAEPDEDNEYIEEPVKPAKKNSGKAKATPAADEQEEPIESEVEDRIVDKKGKKTPAGPADDEEQEETAADEETPAPDVKLKKKKRFNLSFNFKKLDLKKLGSRKTAIGAGLAVVGILVLSWAGYVTFFSGPTQPNNNNKKGIPPVAGNQATTPPLKKETGQVAKVETDKKDTGKKPSEPIGPPKLDHILLLPPETEQVVRINCANLFDKANLFYDVTFMADGQNPGPFIDKVLDKKLGFTALKTTDILMAECFSEPWTFTVVHVMEKLEISKLTKALNLKKADSKLTADPKYESKENPIPNLTYYDIAANPWLEQLGLLGPGLPPNIRKLMLRRTKSRPLFLHLRDQQTLIIADRAPMEKYLERERNKYEDPPKDGIMPVPIKTDLKRMLDQMQPREPWNKGLVVSATLMNKAMVPKTKKNDPVQYRPRPFWDLTTLLEERSPRINVLGIALLGKAQGKTTGHSFRYKTEIWCNEREDANTLLKDLRDETVPRVVEAVEQALKTKTEKDGKNTDGKKADGKNTDAKDAMPFYFLDRPDPIKIMFHMDVSIAKPEYHVPALVMADAYADLAVLEESEQRHQLAKAGKDIALATTSAWRNKVGEGGKKVPSGQYPAGSLPLTLKSGFTVDRPGERISWMACLLPHLGHDQIFGKINFNARWFDSENGASGRTLVPQFIDPNNPSDTRYYDNPELGQPYGATHFVGIAGVGLDAGDPLLEPRRGILQFDHSATVEQVQKGRGLSNAVLMMQIPVDPLTVTPWIAGGGATLRGVPETGSILPFIKKGETKTYALMADGSVRVVTNEISDAVFQAMCTIQGDPPDPFLEKNENAKLLSTPTGK